MVSKKKKLPVGLSDFKRVITDNYYYVDKSLFIQELIDQGAQALLVPRPRRFGKTLNLSMLRYFFEKIEKPVEENIVFAEIEKREDLLWSFLLFGGYLKDVGKRQVNKRWFCELQIPNLEVGYIYDRLVERWFEDRFESRKSQLMLQALTRGEVKEFERYFRDLVLNIFSYHDFGDESEKVYQAFTIGLLVWLGGQYEVKSNRESGYGRYDVMIIPRAWAMSSSSKKSTPMKTKRPSLPCKARCNKFKTSNTPRNYSSAECKPLSPSPSYLQVSGCG